MKRYLFCKVQFLCAVIMLLFMQSEVRGQCPVHNTNGLITGEPYIENNCFAAIDKYLARAIGMIQLVSVNTVSSWGDLCDNTLIGCDDDYLFCQNTNGYCPDRYWCDIDMCVELNASMLSGVASLWGGEVNLHKSFDYYTKSKTAVDDINRAYDDAKLLRPIIGANQYEYVSGDIDKLQIPEKIILEFQNEMQSGDLAYYFTSGVPKQVNFKLKNVGHMYPDAYIMVDWKKIEARMWTYYQARKYINDGYKWLHLGIIEKEIYWTQDDLTYVFDLFDRIRDYAKIKGTFVLLSGNSKEDIISDDGRQLPDFYIGPIYPDEAEIYPYVNLVSDGEPQTSLINNYHEAETAYGCFESPRGPYAINFDNNGGIYSYPNQPGQSASNYEEDYVTWGYDEARWFYEVNHESDGLAIDQLENILCGVRTLESTTRGYLQPQGRGIIGPYNGGDVGWYRLYDHPAVKDGLKTLWTPIKNDKINTTFYCGIATGIECEQENFIQYYNVYNFSVPNPDCSTVYTWHIQNPDGSWEPFTYGTSREFVPSTDGQYKISLRQDNLGFANQSKHGTKSTTFTKYLKAYCCIFHDPEKMSVEQVKSKSDQAEFKIVPNPTSGKFTVSLVCPNSPTDTKVLFEIINLTSTKVYSETFIPTGDHFEKDIDMSSSLNEGMYIAIIKWGGGLFKKSFAYIK